MNNCTIKKLRSGITTGACAAAAAKAAAIFLLTGKEADTVSINAKNGKALTVDAYTDKSSNADKAECFVIKDAGDDPDVTHGIKIVATVIKQSDCIVIDGGKGVGRVTKAGLKIAVGRAAINTVPLEMIETEVYTTANKYNYKGGFKIIISVPDGEKIAKKTMNERLGIVGGISILGTTGIVEPMSDKAIIETIKAEIDVSIAEGRKQFIVAPGNYGRDFAKSELGLDIQDAIKCSNFIGETIDYAAQCGAEKITLVGHAGKLIKLAGGIMNTHSSVADCRMEILAAHCAMAGTPSNVVAQVMDCITVDAAITISKEAGVYENIMHSLTNKIAYHINQRTKGSIQVRCIVFTNEHGVLIETST